MKPEEVASRVREASELQLEDAYVMTNKIYPFVPWEPWLKGKTLHPIVEMALREALKEP